MRLMLRLKWKKTLRWQGVYRNKKVSFTRITEYFHNNMYDVHKENKLLVTGKSLNALQQQNKEMAILK